MNFFMRLFRCWWKGHFKGYGLNRERVWIGNRCYEVTKCMFCDAIMDTMPLLPSGRRYMKVKVEVLEDDADVLSNL